MIICLSDYIMEILEILDKGLLINKILLIWVYLWSCVKLCIDNGLVY